MIVTTADEMRRMDALAIERFGIAAEALMERAGAGAAEALVGSFPHVRKHGVVVIAGKGNNGGDGFVLARLLKRRRVRCEVFLAAPRDQIQGPARTKLLAWQRAGGRITVVDGGDLGALRRSLARAGCIVDGLFGTGLKGEVTGLAAELIALMNASGVPVMALDIPSGLDADRGTALGIAVEAELTVAFAAPKIGCVLFPGARHCGELVVVDIGIPDEAVALVAPRAHAITAADARRMVRPRDPESHKGDHGHLALIAGGRGKTGAAVLAGRAAARAGAGLVSVGCPDTVQPVIAGALLEEMTVPLPDDGRGGLGFPDPGPYRDLLAGKRAVAAGPGIGVSAGCRALIRWLIAEGGLPLVLDADALNCAAELGSELRRPAAGAPMILTPHPGEMARLVRATTSEVQGDRVGAARRLAERTGAIVVLKGARTVTADPDGRVAINLSGNAGLASGGSGDVLLGIIGSLLAQGYPASEAAQLGVFLHGWAADRVALARGQVGLLASDLIEDLPAATASLALESSDS